MMVRKINLLNKMLSTVINSVNDLDENKTYLKCKYFVFIIAFFKDLFSKIFRGIFVVLLVLFYLFLNISGHFESFIIKSLYICVYYEKLLILK